MAKDFLNNCTGFNKLENVGVQLTEEVKEGHYDLEGKLWSREKYWQAQLFTLTHSMNSIWDWFSSNRKAIERRKNYILLPVFRMFDFVYIYIYIYIYIYSKVQHL